MAQSLLMGCRYRSGTSQAVPYVAGAAAIYLQNNTGQHNSRQISASQPTNCHSAGALIMNLCYCGRLRSNAALTT